MWLLLPIKISLQKTSALKVKNNASRKTLMRKDRRQAGPKEYLHEQCQPGLPFLIQCPGWLLPSGHKRLTPWFARIFLSLWGRRCVKELRSCLSWRSLLKMNECSEGGGRYVIERCPPKNPPEFIHIFKRKPQKTSQRSLEQERHTFWME